MPIVLLPNSNHCNCSPVIKMLVSRVRGSARKRARDQDRELCPHCDQNLSVKTFKKHKTLFLKSDGTWIKSYSDMEAADSDIASKNINTYSTQ